MQRFEPCRVAGCRGRGPGRNRPFCAKHFGLLGGAHRTAIANAYYGQPAAYQRAVDSAAAYIDERLDAELVAGQGTD